MSDLRHKKQIIPRLLRRRRSTRAFSVIELMLAVAIMGVIIYALYSVFSQTQRALRRSETDVDVAQRARIILEMISREIEQAVPTFSFWPTNSGGSRILVTETNLIGELDHDVTVQRVTDRTDIDPRTNYLHRIFFFNQRTNAWTGVGYKVVDVQNGVGELLRFESAPLVGQRPLYNTICNHFRTNSPTRQEYLTNSLYRNFRHVADGVIHLTFVPYDTLGQRLDWFTTDTFTTNINSGDYKIARWSRNGYNGNYSHVTETNLHAATVQLRPIIPPSLGEFEPRYGASFIFKSNALPAYIEIELGILEPEALAQYYLMVEEQNPNAANYLARQISKVHLFRQRVPIRAAAQ